MTCVAAAVAGLVVLVGCSTGDVAPSAVGLSEATAPSQVSVTVSATVSDGAPFEVTAPSRAIIVEPGGTATFPLTFEAGSAPVYMAESASNDLRWVVSEVTDTAFFAARGPESLTELHEADGVPRVGVLDLRRSIFLEPSTPLTDQILVHAGLDEKWAAYEPLMGTFTDESRVEYRILKPGQHPDDLEHPAAPDGHATVTLTYQVEPSGT